MVLFHHKHIQFIHKGKVILKWQSPRISARAVPRRREQLRWTKKIAKIDQSIKELESKKESVVAEYDAKITAARDRIKSLEAKKQEILAPKPPRKPRKTKKQKIQEIVKLAMKNGMSVEEIAGQLHVEVED